jgi:pimeloyl-ACP methyl ester carboxylesterase
MSRRVTRAIAASLIALAAVASVAPAKGATGERVVGTWQGTLEGALRLVIHLERGAGGSLEGRMDSPDQGAMGLPIDTLVFANDSLRFEMRAIRGDYAGRMSVTGDSIDGRWRQSGQSFPLLLARIEHATAVPRRPQEARPPYPYDTVAVRFGNPRAAGVTLAGTLTLPRGTGPFACALLITGSGPEDRDETVFGHRPFRVIADHLTRKGIAVLRLDDRGVGASTGNFARATSEDFARDAEAGMEFLAHRGEIDRGKIGLVGHSEGGLIAPMVAARSRDVAFIVLLAGPGIPGDSTLVLQTAAIRRSIGVGEEAIAREAAANRKLYAALRNGDSLAVVTAARELVQLQIAGLPEAQRRALGDPDSIANGAIQRLWSPWMRFFVTYDPRPTLRQVRCPVLAINGSKDVQVLPRENLGAIEQALRAGGNHDVTIRELPGLNHLFQTCTTCTPGEYAQLEETVAPAALEELSRWILRHTAAKR